MANKKKTPARAAKPAKKATRTAQKRRSTTPRSQALPGFEGVRHARLDRLCEGISEVRAIINGNDAIDAEKCRLALEYMHANNIKSYRFANVEMARVPGAEKLRVRTSKEKATAETEDVVDPDTLNETTDGVDDSESKE